MPADDEARGAPSVSVAESIQMLSLQKQVDQHQFEYSSAALLSQERDRNAQRDHNLASQKISLIAFCCLLLAVVSIVIAAFFLNKDSFLSDCLKYIFGGFGGGGIGYFFGYKRAKDK